MLEWITDTAGNIGDALGDGLEWVNDQVDTYIYDSTEEQGFLEKLVSDAVDKGGEILRGFLDGAEEPIEDDLDKKEEEVKVPIWYIWDDTEIGLDDDAYVVHDDTEGGWEAILKWLSKQGDKVGGANAKALDLLPDPMSWLLGPIGMIIDLLQKNQIINPDTFVETGLAIYRLQKELAIRITELEKEAATSLQQPPE